MNKYNLYNREQFRLSHEKNGCKQKNGMQPSKIVI